MRIRVSSANNSLKEADVEGITRDLEKIDRRLHEYKEEVSADVRISHAQRVGSGPGHHVVIELDYGRNHLIAKAENGDMGMAVREAREELLRQINDRKRGGHSARAKGL